MRPEVRDLLKDCVSSRQWAAEEKQCSMRWHIAMEELAFSQRRLLSIRQTGRDFFVDYLAKIGAA